ncbi:MAG TPA: discoidin domain-containing protein, partial [Polyangiaceae bacterium]
ELSGAQQAAVEVGLGSKAELALVELDVKQRRYLASGLRKLAGALSDPLEREASLVGRVLFMRWARIGAAVLVLLAIAWAVSGAVEKRFAKPNIALGRPVTVSSQFPDAALDHTLLVDGDRTNLGFHTDNSPNQWVTIDLGSTKNISKVVVYNRVECCQERAVPLRLEVSDDGVNYKKVADRTEEFDVWTSKGLDVKGRYVRLRHLGANYLHFAEVEIY